MGIPSTRARPQLRTKLLQHCSHQATPKLRPHLRHKVGDHAAVIQGHAGAVRVEDAHDADLGGQVEKMSHESDEIPRDLIHVSVEDAHDADLGRE